MQFREWGYRAAAQYGSQLIYIFLKSTKVIYFFSLSLFLIENNFLICKGYEVHFDGVGFPNNGDLSKGPCSQIAIFKRVFKKNIQNLMGSSLFMLRNNVKDENLKQVAQIIHNRSKNLITDEVNQTE